MSSITLHPDKGVNPRMTVCTQCGKDVGLLLLGRREMKYRCNKCDQVSIGGKPKDRICPSCRATDSYFQDGKIEDRERLNIGEICDDCQELNKQCDEMVAAGGVMWRCTDCGAGGAIRSGHPLSVAIRAQMLEQGQIEPPTRRWECRCGHKWTATVESSAASPNISGEASVWCPKCNEKPLCGEPAVHKPCGVQFTKDEGCPNCGERDEDHQES